MNGDLVQREGTTPGMGVAGLVMCPILKCPCLKSACALWVELTYAAGTKDERKVGNCALAWTPVISSEQTQALNRLTAAMKERTPTDAPTS